MNLRSILQLDARLSKQMRVAEKPGALRSISVFFAHSGDSWFWAIGLFALWISGGSFWKQWAVVQFVCISVLAVLVLSIKFLVRRKRPEGEWGGIYRNTDPHSFPSGTRGAVIPDRHYCGGIGHGKRSCDPVMGLGTAGCARTRCHGRTLCFRYRRGRYRWNCGRPDLLASIRTAVLLGIQFDGFSTLVKHKSP